METSQFKMVKLVNIALTSKNEHLEHLDHFETKKCGATITNPQPGSEENGVGQKLCRKRPEAEKNVCSALSKARVYRKTQRHAGLETHRLGPVNDGRLGAKGDDPKMSGICTVPYRAWGAACGIGIAEVSIAGSSL
jgi:hypothetical protein